VKSLEEKDTEFPTTLVRTPYGVSPSKSAFAVVNTIECFYLATQGYHALVQSTRGRKRHDSTGAWKPIYHERQDGRATLKWIKEQPWFNGVLGTFGESYLGYTQLALIGKDAAIQPKAYVPIITSANFYDAIHHRGSSAIDANLLTGWIFMMEAEDLMKEDAGIFTHIIDSDKFVKDPSITWNASMVVPLVNADVIIMGHTVPQYRDLVVAHNPTEDYWAVSSAHADFEESDGDAFHFISSWGDVFVNDTIGHYEQKQREGKHAYLTVYNGDHYSFLPFKAFKDVNSWLQYRLKGDNSLLRKQRVALSVHPTGEWLYFDSWPPATTLVPLYLSKSAKGVFSGALLEEKPKGNFDGVINYVYNPENPTPNFSGTTLFFGGNSDQLQKLLNRKNSEKDVLIFTGPNLPTDVTISGRPEFDLVVSSSLGYADFYVSLYDYDVKQNTSVNVCEGFVRTTPTSQVKNNDGSFNVHIKCTPITHKFFVSHQIMLLVSSGAHPHWTRNPGTGEHISTATTFVKAEQKIYTHLSSVTLPVLY